MGVAHVLIPQQSHTCSIEITGLSAVTTTARRSDRSLAAKTGVDPLRRASGVSGIQVCKLSLLSLRGGYVVSSIGCAHAVKCALRLAPYALPVIPASCSAFSPSSPLSPLRHADQDHGAITPFPSAKCCGAADDSHSCCRCVLPSLNLLLSLCLPLPESSSLSLSSSVSLSKLASAPGFWPSFFSFCPFCARSACGQIGCFPRTPGEAAGGCQRHTGVAMVLRSPLSLACHFIFLLRCFHDFACGLSLLGVPFIRCGVDVLFPGFVSRRKSRLEWRRGQRAFYLLHWISCAVCKDSMASQPVARYHTYLHPSMLLVSAAICIYC